MVAMRVLETLQREWAVIAEAPVTFTVLVAAAALAIYALARAWYAREIANLNSTIKLREAEIANWKLKTEGETPDDVRARLNKLEMAQRGRRLSDGQREIIRRMADTGGGDLVALYIHELVGAPDAARYARDLRGAFEAAGWRVGGSSLVSSIHSRTGLLVTFDLRERRLPGENNVLASLRQAGIPFEVMEAGHNGAISMTVSTPEDD